jgi:type II secretory pathway pseudopilin PulG
VREFLAPEASVLPQPAPAIVFAPSHFQKSCPESVHPGARVKIRPSKTTVSGGTLVEVVIAIALLALVASGVLGSFKYGFYEMGVVRENQRATQIVLAKLETLRLYNWDQVRSNGFIPTTFTDVYDPQAPVGNQGASYTGFVTISNMPSAFSSKSYYTNMRACTVVVSWNTGSLSHRRSVTTYIAKDGIQNYVY